MQDNDSKYSPRSNKSWFTKNDDPVLEWPSQSPELNPIENILGVLKKLKTLKVRIGTKCTAEMTKGVKNKKGFYQILK